MIEKTINEDVTLAGSFESLKSGKSPERFEGTISDTPTIGGVEMSPPLAQVSNFGEAVLAEIDQFALMKKLGEGAAGKVYKAIDRETGVEVAVKGLPVSVSETTKACLKANFQIVTKLNHPNIAAAKEYHVIRSVCYKDDVVAKDFQH